MTAIIVKESPCLNWFKTLSGNKLTEDLIVFSQDITLETEIVYTKKSFKIKNSKWRQFWGKLTQVSKIKNVGGC